MNDVVITIAVILFPGFLAALIVENFLNYSPKWTAFKFGIYSFLLGVLTYIALQLSVWLIGLFPSRISFLSQLTGELDIWNFASKREGTIDLIEVFAAVAFSPIIGIITTRLANDRRWFGLKRATGSSKYGNENLFSNFLAAKNLGYVYIRDYELDLMYEGTVASFSENDDIQEIVLENVRIFRNHDSEHLETLPSLYISKSAGEFLIEDAPETIVEVTDDTANT